MSSLRRPELEIFPLDSVYFNRYSNSQRRITTTLANLEASGSCKYCNITVAAIKQACKRIGEGNTRCSEELPVESVSKVEIAVRRDFSIELVIARGSPSEFHLELYTESSKCPELSFYSSIC